MELNELIQEVQRKGYHIHHLDDISSTIFEIRLKDDTLIFGRCEVAYSKRIQAKKEIFQKLEELAMLN